MSTLLQIKNVSIFRRQKQVLGKIARKRSKVVDGITINVNKGETYGLIGATGCGKTTLARAILGLEQLTSGDILYEGISIKPLYRHNKHPLRQHLQMVFQNPFASLNPRKQIGAIIAEPLDNFTTLSAAEKVVKVYTLLEQLGLNKADLIKYPHEFSGGEQQRIAIARALVLEPELLIIDEPFSALDISTQADIITLLKRIQKEKNFTMLFITHDLHSIQKLCQRVGVMESGKIIEEGLVSEIFTKAQHIYTRQLLAAMPVNDPLERAVKTQARVALQKMVKQEYKQFYDEQGNPYALKEITATHLVARR